MAPAAVSLPIQDTAVFPQLTAPALNSRVQSPTSLDEEELSRRGSQYHSRSSSYTPFHSHEVSHLSSVVHSLKRRTSHELGSGTSARLLNATHDSILEWIRTQRMTYLPPEGSSYDKVLAWAQLFVERLHSFDMAIGAFAGDSYLAAQLAYGYCSILLEVRSWIGSPNQGMLNDIVTHAHLVG